MEKRRWVIGISGASGAPLAIELLKALKSRQEIETWLVVTAGGELTLRQECSIEKEELLSLADYMCDNNNLSAGMASGSWKSEGLVIVPCSMKTVAGIACGFSDNLLLRAADVMIKEQRRLILAARETPLSPVHLNNLLELSRLGVRIVPPVLSYYNHPETVTEMTRHIVGKIMDQMGLDYEVFQRWEDRDGANCH